MASRTHPAIIVAAIAITVLAAVGMAALTGYLPIAWSVSTPFNTSSPGQQQGTVPGDSLSDQYGGGPTNTEPASPQPMKVEPPKAAVAKAPPAPAAP